MKAWTDYPISALGDVGGQEAPVRACTVLAFDGDKYVTIEVCGARESVKAGYIYTAAGRYGEVQPVSRHLLARPPIQ